MISLTFSNIKIENIDTVLFDKDGTLIDLHYFWGKMTEMRANEIIRLSNQNNSILPKLCLFLGYNINSKRMIPDGITALYSRSEIIKIFQKNLANIGIGFSIAELETIFDNVSKDFYKTMVDYTKPIEEALEFVKLLKEKNIKTGIVTADSVKSTLLTLDYYKWNELFDIIIGRESSKMTKESGEPVKLALSKLNSLPEKTIMIGDSHTDYIAAKNAGISNTILVSTGQITKEELKKHTKFTVQSLSEIKILTKSELSL